MECEGRRRRKRGNGFDALGVVGWRHGVGITSAVGGRGGWRAAKGKDWRFNFC